MSTEAIKALERKRQVLIDEISDQLNEKEADICLAGYDQAIDFLKYLEWIKETDFE